MTTIPRGVARISVLGEQKSSAEGVWGGGVTPHWGGVCPLPRRIFNFFYIKMVSSGAFWVAIRPAV